MGFLGKIENWLEERKNSKPKGRKPLSKRRKNLGVVDFKCFKCGHHKAFKKGEILKCTKCGNRIHI
jgi:exosome complex RNA-binding protein Csl4